MKTKNIDLVKLTKVKEFESLKYLKIGDITFINKAFRGGEVEEKSYEELKADNGMLLIKKI